MSPLMPIAGAAALSLAREAIGAIGSGLSFATEVIRQDHAAVSQSSSSPLERPVSLAQHEFEQAIRDFVARLRQRLAAAGVELSGSLELKIDGLGGIEVGGNRSDEWAIEGALAADGQMLAEFNRLAEWCASLGDSDDLRRNFGLLVTGEDAEVLSA